MKNVMVRLALLVIAIATLSYGGIVAWLVIHERTLVFQPSGYGGREQVPLADSLGLAVESVSIPSTRGVKLATWLIRADSTGPWLLLCHGNAGNITLFKRQRFYRDAARRGFNMVAFDYRGFGASSDTVPTEQGLYDDARAEYDYLRNSLKVPPSRIVIYGHSLGGGVATELATSVAAAGLILEGTFLSVPAVGQERYPYLPIRLLAENHFDNAERIPRLKMPLLVLHARADHTIPSRQGELLFRLAPGPKEYVSLGGDHDSAWERDHDRYMLSFARFVDRVVPKPAHLEP